MISRDTIDAQHGDTENVYLPPMRAGYLSIPHILACCKALRAGRGNERRKNYTKDAPLQIDRIFGYKKGTVLLKYEGEVLCIGDIELWSKSLQLAASNPLGNSISFTQGEMRKALSRPSSGTTYKGMRKEVERLNRAHFTLSTSSIDIINVLATFFPKHPSLQEAKTTGFAEISFSMFGSTSFSGNTWTVEIPHMVRVLFGEKNFALYNEEMYYALKRPTSRRLFLLYGHHDKKFPLTCADLQEYTGSAMTGTDDLKKLMDAAHAELVQVGFIAAFEYKQSAKRNGSRAYVLTPNSVPGDATNTV